jgi:putative hemolysin
LKGLKMKVKSLLVLFCLLITGCIQITTQPGAVITPEAIKTLPTIETLPNPASAYCEQKGYKLEIRIAPDGSQAGVCIFPNGNECDEWAYFRGECIPASKETPTGSPENDSSGWKTYTNALLGYSFQYPADAQVTTNDEPLKSLYISGPGMGSETWGFAHPVDREEYRPPEGVDLLQWLTDHNLLGEVRLPDEQIAGTTAIHFRHERSPQSYADDRYYYARNGQLYLVTIGHSSDTEDWELNNHFLESIQFEESASNASASTPLPTALPIDPTVYQDWMTYTDPIYNFTVRLPDDWIVEEVTTGDPPMSGHALNLHPVDDSNKESIHMIFRQIGDETPLWPTGVGQGEFIPQGRLEIAGQPAQRVLLVCPTGEVTEIWYHNGEGQPAIMRANLEFGIIFDTNGHCEPGYSLGGERQQLGETIISSLMVP